MSKLLSFYYLLLYCSFVGSLSAQTFELRGRVIDSLSSGVVGASVQLATDHDTLRSVTDAGGNFRFSVLVKMSSWKLMVKSLGYDNYSQQIDYKGSEDGYVLPSITLQTKAQRLEEVLVKAPNPIRIVKDTVEYLAGAYVVGKQDRLEDLLRQLPGVGIDAVGNVTAQGQPMIKLRVNGKDFFTNNLKDFLSQLPADIIAKLQVIDDYGDQANFTGIKVGKPQKMLNLVIKEGQSKGVFGTAETSGNTQKLWSGGMQGNLWFDPHQLSAHASTNGNRTEEGRQRSTDTGSNYRRSGDRSNFYGNYNYTNTYQTGNSQSYSETATGQGTLYSHIAQAATNKGQQQQAQLDLQSRGKKDFVDIQMTLQHVADKRENQLSSQQTGVILQDLDNHTQTDSKNSSENVSLSWSHNMQNTGRSLSANMSGSTVKGIEHSDIEDKLIFYDQTKATALKDSVNRRLLYENRRQSILKMTLKYAEPLNDYALAKVKRTLDLSYGYTFQYNDQLQETNVWQYNGLQRIDSMSQDYGVSLMTQQLDLSYRSESAKMQYNLGLSLQPIQMHGNDGKQRSVVDNRFILLPIATLRCNPTLKNSISLNYSGSINPPQFLQLIPLRDVRNLQQVSVGNPDLKPAKSHSLSLNFSRVEPINGQTYSFSMDASFIRDHITSNLLLIRDTLGNLRQENHFLNVNGSYNLATSYDMTRPFAKHYQVRWSTQVSKNHNIAYLDGAKGANDTFYWSQNMGFDLNTKKFRGAVHVNYNVTQSRYELNVGLRSHIRTWEISGDTHWIISSVLTLSAEGNYRLNRGYTIPVKNTILLNVATELFLTARRELSLQLRGYDLLDQQQSINVQVTAQGVTQQTLNRIGRYGELSVKYNLSRFGGKK